jgi:hypothetical protein
VGPGLPSGLAPAAATVAVKNHIIGCRETRKQRAVFQNLESQRQFTGTLPVATESVKKSSHGQSASFCWADDDENSLRNDSQVFASERIGLS